MLTTQPSEYFSHLNLGALDAGSAQFIKEEIIPFKNLDLLKGSDVMDELNDLIAGNFPEALTGTVSRKDAKPAEEKQGKILFKAGELYRLKNAIGHAKKGDEVEIRNDYTVYPGYENEKVSVRCCNGDRIKEILDIPKDELLPLTLFAEGQTVYVKDNKHTRAKEEVADKGHFINVPCIVDHIIEEKEYVGGKTSYSYVLTLNGKNIGMFEEDDLSRIPQEPVKSELEKIAEANPGRVILATMPKPAPAPAAKKPFTKAEINGAIQALERTAKYKTGKEKKNYEGAIGNLKRQLKYALMAKGGPISYEGKTAEQVWNAWKPEQRKHFLLDHFGNGFWFNNHYQTRFKWNNDSDFFKDIEEKLTKHISEGQYGKGGPVAGLHLADEENTYGKGGGIGGKYGVNKKYTHFAVSKKTGKIVNGWETISDVESLKYYAKQDLIDMDLKPADFKILSAATLKREGTNPFDWNSWAKTGEKI